MDLVEASSIFGYEAATLPGPVARRLYSRASVCAGCRQAIRGPLSSMRHGRMFHPTCAQRHDGQQRPTVPAPAPAVLATLTGVALSFDKAGCGVGSGHERFLIDSFNSSLAAGGQCLTVNHSFSRRLRGAFSRIFVDAGELKFRFSLLDGPHEHATLEKIRNGQIRYCSIGFQPQKKRYAGRVIVFEQASLTEISLCDGTVPAWYDTKILVE